MRKNRKNDIITALLPLLGVAAVLAAWMLLMMAIESGGQRKPEPTIAPAPAECAWAVPAATPEPAPTLAADEPLWPYDPDIPLDDGLQQVLYAACLDYDVPVELVLGVMEVESCFDPTADNGLCYGLMQLNRRYFADGLPPEDNIRCGVAWLAELLAQYDTPSAALTAYNAGWDHGGRNYAAAVLEAAERWARNGGTQ